MVYVTDRAKRALLEAKRRAGIVYPDCGLRLMFGHDGTLGLVPDRPNDEDEVVSHADVTVLLVDPETSLIAVTGRTLDCRQTDDGDTRFFLRQAEAGEGHPSSAA
jgi:hypothetical protein